MISRRFGRAGFALSLLAATVLVFVASCGSARQPDAAATTQPTTTAQPTATPAPSPTPSSTPPAPTTPTASPTATPPLGGGPSASATPVFVDEPCDARSDTKPQAALRGLTLYCSGGSGEPVWGTQPPTSPSPAPSNPGSSCDGSQNGAYARSAQGRPLECLRDPDGRYRWVDVS
jgi:hypothetical protein